MTRFLTLAALSFSAFTAMAQGPARDDILAQCPQLAEQLPEQLASIKQQVGTAGTVRVQLVLGADGVQRIESIEGPRAYRSRVKSALLGADCRSSTLQRQVLNIRFEDPAQPLPLETRSAALSASTLKP
jgi:hypothetical protein